MTDHPVNLFADVLTHSYIPFEEINIIRLIFFTDASARLVHSFLLKQNKTKRPDTMLTAN